MGKASFQDLFPIPARTQGCVAPRCARLDSTPGLGQEVRPSRAPEKGHRTILERACQNRQREEDREKDCPLFEPLELESSFSRAPMVVPDELRPFLAAAESAQKYSVPYSGRLAGWGEGGAGRESSALSHRERDR